MPRLLVVADPPHRRRTVLEAEINLAIMDDETAAIPLLERVAVAVADAEKEETHPAKGRHSHRQGRRPLSA